MLSQRCRYALKALLYLARASDNRPRQTTEIARDEEIPHKFLEGIMTELRREGIVGSVRGKFGGYRLSRPATEIFFGEIIRIIDGPLALVPCVSRNFYKRCDDCRDEISCELRKIMEMVRNEVSEKLDRTALADAVGRFPDAATALIAY